LDLLNWDCGFTIWDFKRETICNSKSKIENGTIQNSKSKIQNLIKKPVMKTSSPAGESRKKVRL